MMKEIPSKRGAKLLHLGFFWREEKEVFTVEERAEVEFWIEKLGDEDWYVRRAAREALKKLRISSNP